MRLKNVFGMKFLEKIATHSSFHTGILIARLWLGAIMLKHSGTYLFGEKMKELIGFLASLGFPFPEICAYLSQVTELVTAILIILGLRIGAIVLALNMAVAVIFAHKMLVFTEGELAFNYFILALLISLLGTGKYGLDHVILGKIGNKV